MAKFKDVGEAQIFLENDSRFQKLVEDYFFFADEDEDPVENAAYQVATEYARLLKERGAFWGTQRYDEALRQALSNWLSFFLYCGTREVESNSYVAQKRAEHEAAKMIYNLCKVVGA